LSEFYLELLRRPDSGGMSGHDRRFVNS